MQYIIRKKEPHKAIEELCYTIYKHKKHLPKIKYVYRKKDMVDLFMIINKQMYKIHASPIQITKHILFFKKIQQGWMYQLQLIQ